MPERPRRCAKCGARYWWLPSRVPHAEREPGELGRPLKYPEIEFMEVGDEIIIPWIRMPDGELDYTAVTKPIHAVRRYAKTYGIKFHTYRTGSGLGVVRIA